MFPLFPELSVKFLEKNHTLLRIKEGFLAYITNNVQFTHAPTRTNSAWKLDLEKRKKNTSSFGQGTFELRSSYIYVLKKRKNKLVDAQREVSSLHWVFINISGRVTKSKYTRIKRAYLKSCKLDLSSFFKLDGLSLHKVFGTQKKL